MRTPHPCTQRITWGHFWRPGIILKYATDRAWITTGCKAGVEVPDKRCLQTSPKVAQLIVFSKFTEIQPIRLSQHLLSSCFRHQSDFAAENPSAVAAQPRTRPGTYSAH